MRIVAAVLMYLSFVWGGLWFPDPGPDDVASGVADDHGRNEGPDRQAVGMWSIHSERR